MNLITDEEINEVKMNPQNDLIFVTTNSGHVRILKYDSLQDPPIYSFLAHHGAACSVIDFDPRSRYFATGGGDAIAVLCTMIFIDSRGFGNFNFCAELHRIPGKS